MGRNRTPTDVLRLKGAFRKDPKRGRERANEPKPTGPLGKPPSGFDEIELEMWAELEDICPPGVLKNADRWVVEIACKLMAKVREDGIGGKRGASVGELSQLNNCLIRLGMTPADRSKIKVDPDKEESNPFEELAAESEVVN